MPERMPDRMSEWMPDRMPERRSEKEFHNRLPESMSEQMSDRMPERMSDRMPVRMPVRMSDISCQKEYQIFHATVKNLSNLDTPTSLVNHWSNLHRVTSCAPQLWRTFSRLPHRGIVGEAH